MPSMKDITTDDLIIKALIYGCAGCRKTTLAGTFPKPIMYFDFDHKMDVLAGQDIDYESYDCRDRTGKEYRRFVSDLSKAKMGDKYKTIVVDSLTTLDYLLLWEMCRLSGKVREKPTLDDYGRQGDAYLNLFMDLMDPAVNKNVVVCAHEAYIENELSKVHMITPLVTGQKILAKIPAVFKDTWHITTGGDGSCILWYKPHNKAVASSSVLAGDGKLTFVGSPSYDQIKQAIQKQRK